MSGGYLQGVTLKLQPPKEPVVKITFSSWMPSTALMLNGFQKIYRYNDDMTTTPPSLSFVLPLIQSSRIQERSDVGVVKTDIVNYAMKNWLREFSRMFDGFVTSGPNLPKIAVRLACNSEGLLVFSFEKRDAPQLLNLSYSQIKKVDSVRYVDGFHP